MLKRKPILSEILIYRGFFIKVTELISDSEVRCVHADKDLYNKHPNSSFIFIDDLSHIPGYEVHPVFNLEDIEPNKNPINEDSLKESSIKEPSVDLNRRNYISINFNF